MEKELNLENLKKIEFEILKKFDLFCKKNNLRYALDSGTLLGCIRHNGFIPWDDDIDLIMPRDDYNKFISIIQSTSNNNEIGLWDNHTYKNYPYFFAKLKDNNTILIEEQFKHQNQPGGVYIDIFPLDSIPNNKIKRALYRLRFNWYQFLISVLSYGRHNKFNPWYIRVCSWFFLLFPISINKLHEKSTNFIMKHNNDTSDYVSTHFKDYKRNRVLPFICNSDHQFEGLQFPIPKDYDYYLTETYGNYMEFPPIEERKPIHTFKAYLKQKVTANENTSHSNTNS